MKKNFAIAAVFSVLSLAASGANAAIVADGDFSLPSGGSMFTDYTAGQSFGPWTVNTGGVDLIGGYWQAPSVGGGSLDLDGLVPGSISQGLSIGAGSYVLTFSLSGNPDGGVGSKFMAVSVGDVVNQQFTYNVTGANSHGSMNYITETLAFTTTGATTLQFASLDTASAYGAVIGNVSVSAVPLPAAFWMFMTGLVALLGVQTVRNRKAKALS